MITTVRTGESFKTRGGWVAFIYTCINGNPQGWCKDEFGHEESSMGTWDKQTGKCLKRGNSTHTENTTPFDLIESIS